MGRVLATDVHVVGPGGPLDFVVLPAGSRVPDEYADQVTAESAYRPDGADQLESDTDTGDGTLTGYDALTVKDLQELLEQRDLAHSGTKAELIARLQDDDLQRGVTA